MSKFKFAQLFAATMACLGTMLPQCAFGAPPQANKIADVALRSGGTLVGAVYDSQGLPAEGAIVSVQQSGKEVARTQTDQKGRFIAEGLQGGVYQIATAKGVAVYRAWTPGTAPPAAQQQALVINGDVVRGIGNGEILAFLSNPWVLAGIVATAIAVPIAVSDDDDNDSGS